ncbi:MAG: T9SS type A sorting domain-containing protein [Bacteroidota bacterium]
MKKLLLALTLLIASSQLLSAQSNCSSPVSFTGFISGAAPAPGSVMQSGPDYGCATYLLSPTWISFACCNSGDLLIDIYLNHPGGNDSGSFVMWGPFQNTTNICNQLTAAKIVDCEQTAYLFGLQTAYVQNVQPGEIYYMMLGSGASVTNYSVSSFIGGPNEVVDGSCTICNNTVSIMQQDICLVTADSATTGTKIIWEESNLPGIASTTLWRESVVNGVYDSITTQLVSALSEYVDATANMNIRPWCYRINANDSCGNTRFTAPTHTTLHLQTSQGTSGTANLSWTPYMGFPYTTFYIYRGTSPGSLSIIDSLPSTVTSYTDLAAPGGIVYYQVEVRKASACSPSRNMGSIYGSALSNIKTAVVTDVHQYSLLNWNIYPNPVNDFIRINLEIFADRDLSIYIKSMDGKIIKNINSKGESMLTIDVTDIAPGIYFVEMGDQTAIRNKIIIQ